MRDPREFASELQIIAAKDRKLAIGEAFTYWLDKEMPLRYRGVSLSKLQPSDKNRLSLATQQWLYDEVRNNLGDGFMIFGPVGTGKTTVAVGYYRYWLYQDIKRISNEYPDHETAFVRFVLKSSSYSVWKQEAKSLLMEHHDFAINRPVTNAEGEEIKGAKTPLVTAEKIRRLARSGITPRLVLEEIDKVELTKARRDTLFEILDTLDAEMGKFFLNTNLTPAEFENQYGAQFVRRIKQSCRVIDLYKENK